MSALTNGADDGAHGELVPVGPPPALRWNLWATAVWCGLSILSNLVLFGERAYERRVVIDFHNSSKNRNQTYTNAAIDHDIHSRLLGGLVQVLLITVILMLLAVLTWRSRPVARWGLLAMATIPGVFFGVGLIAQLVVGTLVSAPGLYKTTVVAAGFAAVLVVVLLLHRTTREYFAALRETQRGNLPAVPGSRVPGSRLGALGSTGARPAGGGLGALFAPRRRPGPAARSDAAANDFATNEKAASDAAPSGAATSDTATGNTDATSVERSSAATASQRPSATRPGRVKAKGSGNRPGRFKSRQQ